MPAEEAIRKAVLKRARWMLRHVADREEALRARPARQYVSGEQVLYPRPPLQAEGRRGAARRERSIKLKGGLLVVATDNTDQGGATEPASGHGIG